LGYFYGVRVTLSPTCYILLNEYRIPSYSLSNGYLYKKLAMGEIPFRNQEVDWREVIKRAE